MKYAAWPLGTVAGVSLLSSETCARRSVNERNNIWILAISLPVSEDVSLMIGDIFFSSSAPIAEFLIRLMSISGLGRSIGSG